MDPAKEVRKQKCHHRPDAKEVFPLIEKSRMRRRFFCPRVGLVCILTVAFGRFSGRAQYFAQNCAIFIRQPWAQASISSAFIVNGSG